MKTFYRIADFNVCIVFKDDEKSFAIPASYAPFEISASQAAQEPVLLTLTIDDSFSFQTKGKEIGHFNEDINCQSVYRLPDNSYQFELCDYSNHLVCIMQTSPDFSFVTIRLTGNEEQLQFGLTNAWMIAFAFASAPRQSLLMHSSVTLFQGKGNLFLGKSGTGKSTHSQLWLKNFQGTELLNDDNPVVRVKDGHVIVYGSPWSGKTPCYRNKSVPTNAFVQLEQKPYNKIDRLVVTKAFASLLSSCSTMIWDKRTFDAICKTLSDILQRIPVYHLSCRPDDEAAQLCQSVIA